MREKIVKTLLQLGLIVNPEDVDNPGLLNVAVEKGYLKNVEDLLKYGADVNMLERPRFGESLTPLHSAVKSKQVEMVELLIQYGANVNDKGSEGTIPLVYSIGNRDTEMTKLLLSNGADIKEDPNLLCTAVMNGSLKIVEYLLQYGADVDMLGSSKFGESLTPLHSAVKSNQLEMTKLLINYEADVNIKDGEGTSPLVDAIQNKATEMIKLLLINGADTKEDPNLLCTAVMNGSLKIVKDLLKYGADVNMLGSSKFGESLSPLHSAVRSNQMKMAKLLLLYGADVNMIEHSIFGQKLTPLHIAVKSNQVEMVKLLIKYGADVNVEVGRGFMDLSPIQYAIENSATEITKLLLINGVHHGADVNGSGSYQMTALHCTVLYCGEDERRLKFCKMDREELIFHRRCNHDIAELLLSKGANVNAATESGITTLCAASQKNYEDIVEILLKYGAECDPRDEEIIKPLHAAALGGHSKIIENLLKCGAEVDSRDIYGRTALHFASRGGHVETVKTLLEYGSDVNIVSERNHTPLEYGKFFEDVDSDDNDEGDEDDDYHYNLDSDDYHYIRDNDGNLCHTNDSPTTKLLKQHIAKMKTAGLHVSDRNLLWISNDHEINNFINGCEAEIEIMKSEKIDNSYVSVYDILTKSTSQFAKNKSIVQALKSDDYKTKFPIYANMIGSRFRRGILREELLKQVRDKLLKSLPKLPLLCTEKIFSYLSDKDLRILLVDCKP
ncbi:uncharacterized protein LOC143210928 [Lasioglossum baleicum]|uniref:uncharacterized protein LOC143210928 n=1 Tax=Lasioglossum baleicum TaxID=434251 RepID=UPI003FCE6F4E